MNPEFRWLNVFIRDILLIAVIGYLQWATNFNSKTVFLITGMMIVWVSWQLTDYLNYKRVKWRS